MKRKSLKGYSNCSPRTYRKATIALGFSGSKNIDILAARLSQNRSDRELEKIARNLQQERSLKASDAHFQEQFTQFVINCLNKFETSGKATPNWVRVLIEGDRV